MVELAMHEPPDDLRAKKRDLLGMVHDERVAPLDLKKAGAKLTTLTKEQASYLGVEVEGP